MKDETIEGPFLQRLHVPYVHEHRAVERLAACKSTTTSLIDLRGINRRGEFQLLIEFRDFLL